MKNTEEKTILLIEDNPGDSRLIKEMLKEITSSNYQLVVAETLKEGCGQIRKHKFMLILLDLNLPDSTGKSTFDTVMKFAGNIPVVLVSGLEHKELSLLLIKEGAQDYILKQDCNSSLLGKTIQYALIRKNTEVELQESKQKYQNLFHKANEGLILMTMDGKFAEVNQSFAQMHGYSVKEINNMDIKELDVLREDTFDSRAEIMNRILAGEIVRFEVEHYHKDGHSFFLSTSASLITIENQQYFLAFHQDITERKQAEEALRIKNQVFEDSIAAMSISDITGTITHVNQAFLRLWGYNSKEQVIGNSIGLFFNDHADSVLVLEALTSNDEWEGEFLAKRADGTTFISHGIATSLRNTRGEHIGYQSTNLDITKEAEAVQALKESERDLEKRNIFINTILENLTFGIAVNFMDSGLTEYVNPAYSRVYGWPAEDMKDIESFFKHIYPDPVYSAQQMKMVMEDINSGYPERMHWEGFMITTKTGEKRFLEARNIPLPDQNLMISIAWDITERKQAEEAKRASEELFKHVFEDANVGKSIITPGGEIKVNKAFCNLLGYQYEELQNKNQKDITHPDDIELTQNEMNKLINDEAQQVRFNKRYLHKNGSIIWADVSSSSMRDKTGELKNLITTIIDITERKKAEKALQASKDFLDKIINSVASPIFVKDDLHRFCLVNDALYSLLNLPVEKLIGTTGYEYFPEEQMKIFIAKDQKVFLSGIENINEEQLTDGTGKVRYIITRKTLYTDTAGKKFLVGVISDITERKHAEEALNELNLSLEHIIAERTEQLEITNKELESFAYSVSHDLRAPLRGIDGFSKILLEDYSDVLDHEGHRLLNVIITNIQKMSQLIEDLLNFSRISRQDIKRYKIDMKNLFSSCYFELTTDEQRDKIIFDLDVVPESFGDPALIKQLITNLLSNAIKFSSKTANPSIIIGYNVDNKKVIFFIRDNGVGFDMKYYDKLFGVFQRLHSNVEYEGTGVGLAIAQRIINRHGGNIWAESVLNEGATFYFSL